MKKLFVILALLSFATACQGFGGTWAFGPWTSGESLIDPGLDQSPFWDDSAGRMAWGPVPTPTLPGGSDTEVQYNNSGAFGGDPTFTFDDATNTLDVNGVTITGTTAIGLDMSGGTFATAIQKWPVGTIQSTGDIVFQPTSDGTTRYQWLDAAGDSILTLNSINRKVTVERSSFNYPFTIKSDDGSCSITFYHDNTQANMRWTDGPFTISTDEGVNTDTVFEIKGKGTGMGFFRMFNEDNSAFTAIFTEGNQGQLSTFGTGDDLWLQANAHAGVDLFRFAAAGETPEFSVRGQSATSGSRKKFVIAVESLADDTVSLTGLSNYLVAGNLITKNFTHSDADDAGATSWTAKRERSGGEEADVFSITGSHDGSGDNQLAKMVFSVNTGSGVVDIIEIDSSGNTKIGDAGVTDYTQFSIIGDQTFVGTAGFYPRRVSQSAIPAAGTGSTQVDIGEFMVWRDSDDAKIYLLYNDTDSGIKSIEML